MNNGLAMEINATTEIYGILGNPVAHSLSPAMHNAAFAAFYGPLIVPLLLEKMGLTSSEKP